MSRRPPPTAAQERAAQNQQTIKALLKLDANKSCADCKRNKHPRWASWNLGIFVCIRCSGIHRGMGTHISRVKSVDLDAWTDEQLQSVLRWGNTRANIYWESKLTAGHMPSDAKIENFIRTKYESKRWVMDGPMPDPSTLDAQGDDDVPLNVVQEKAKLERNTSQRSSHAPAPATPAVDLFGDIPAPPARPSTTGSSAPRAPPPASTSGPPKATKTSESLLGLDFLGNTPAPSKTGTNSSLGSLSSQAPSQTDLKQSILSLYAAAPKPKSVSQDPGQAQSASQSSFGGLQNAPPSGTSNLAGLNDAFGGLGVGTKSSQASNKTPSDPFSAFQTAATSSQTTSATPAPGSFFNQVSNPQPKPAQTQKAPNKPMINLAPTIASDFGDFSFTASTPMPSNTKPTPPSSNSVDFFALDEPMPTFTTSSVPPQALSSNNISTPAFESPFNLSAKKPAPPQAEQSTLPSATKASSTTGFANSEAWGSSDAWATPDPTPVEAPKPQPGAVPSIAHAPSLPMTNDFSAWGSSDNSISQGTTVQSAPPPAPAQPKISANDDFGGWSSAAVPAATTVTSDSGNAHTTSSTKSTSGGFGGEDLFSNVWE